VLLCPKEALEVEARDLKLAMKISKPGFSKLGLGIF